MRIEPPTNENLFCSFEGFYSHRRKGGKKTLANLRPAQTIAADVRQSGASGVGERLVEFVFVFEFTHFENFAAIETFYVLGVVIPGDQLSLPVRALRFRG